MIEDYIFYILSIFLVIGSIAMIRFKQSVFSSISFLLAMVALAGMFALLHQNFLFLAQVLVSVGAVVTLTLLVMVSINIQGDNLPKDSVSNKEYGFLVLLIIPILLVIFKAISKTDLKFKEVDESFGSLQTVGTDLFTNWVLPFEAISLLLLTALIGGILISKRKVTDES